MTINLSSLGTTHRTQTSASSSLTSEGSRGSNICHKISNFFSNIVHWAPRTLPAPNPLRAVMDPTRMPKLGLEDRCSRIIHREIALAFFEYLDGNDIHTASKVNVAWYKLTENKLTSIKENLFKNTLMTRLLPGISLEQLPLGLTSYNHKTGQTAWEKTYNDISSSPLIYGPAFFKSIGVRTGFADKIPQTLLEKKYLPTHSVEVDSNSTLGLTQDGNLTHGPQDPGNSDDLGHYAPIGHIYYRNRFVADEEMRTVEFPNTEYNRNFIAADPSLSKSIAPYPMQSPLEQGSPLIAFQTNLEIDVPEESPLRATEEGILTEEPGPTDPAVNGKRTVRFLNTPHNWLTLAQPVRIDSTRWADRYNWYYTGAMKYLNENAKPIENSSFYVGYHRIESEWDIPVPSGWEAPSSKLVALGGTYAQSEGEAQALGLHPLTFQQNSIHRILTQIRGNPDPYPKQFSRTSTNGSISQWTTYKAGTYVYPAAMAPVTPARVSFEESNSVNGSRTTGLAAGWGSAGSS